MLCCTPTKSTVIEMNVNEMRGIPLTLTHGRKFITYIRYTFAYAIGKVFTFHSFVVKTRLSLDHTVNDKCLFLTKVLKISNNRIISEYCILCENALQSLMLHY